MNGMQRRKELVSWLEEAGTLSTSEIAARFEVSKMTVHRDLDILEERQRIRRIFGGAMALESTTNAWTEGEPPEQKEAGESEKCLICYRPATQHLLYGITMENGERKLACCPHCGVSAHLMFKEQIRIAITADYLTGKPHSAQHSHFLLGSAAAPCCHPSILTFENLEMAQRFQTGFGGQLGRLGDALRFLEEEMILHREGESCPHCAAARKKNG